MAKKGLDISTIQSVLRDVKDSGGWSLCVGAGTSMPALPDWFALVEKLINKNCSSKDIIDINVYKKMGFSADAMIQAVRNRLDVNDNEFIQMLSEEVYAPIKNNINLTEWNAFIKVHEAFTLSGIRDDDWKTFKGIIDKVLNSTSANLLAKVVVEAIRNGECQKSCVFGSPCFPG